MENPDNLHFLAYCRVFLKEQIHIYVKVASGNAPSHSSHYLQNKDNIYLSSMRRVEKDRKKCKSFLQAQ